MQSPSKARLDVPAVRSFINYCKVRSVPARRLIIHAGDQSESLFYLVKGSVEVMIEDEDGKEIVLAYLNEGHFFGEMGFFYQKLSRTAWVRTRTKCEIAEMTYSRFERLIQENQELVVELAVQLANRLTRTNQKLGDLAFLDVAGRVAHELANLAREPDAVPADGGMAVKVTRSQLGRLVGCTREMVGRVLKILVDQGLIVDDGRTIVVLDQPPRSRGQTSELAKSDPTAERVG